jgi:2,4-dienoyl-CoA reductase-like NADH-dependent reductase (Old Yellow Enzyme family)
MIMAHTSALFEPLAVRALTVPNRVWLSPMCMYAAISRDGMVTRGHQVHYGQFALGGVGLMLTEATAVVPEGRVTPFDAGLWSDAQVEPWREVVDTVHDLGGRIAVQLAHAGRKSGHYPGLPGDEQPAVAVPCDEGGWVSLGATGMAFGDYPHPRPASDEDLRAAVDAYVDAARRAVSVGFDAVEIHAGHGYLIHEFLSPVTNTRADRWGGSVEGRERLLREIVRDVRSAVGPDLPVLVRLSAEDAVPGGTLAADTAATSIRLIGDGADLIDCSGGGLVAGTEYRPGPGYQVAAAEEVHRAGAPAAAVGMITSAAQAETIIRTGQADAVLLGRELLRNPFWAQQAARELGVAVPAPRRYYRAHWGEELTLRALGW